MARLSKWYQRLLDSLMLLACLLLLVMTVMIKSSRHAISIRLSSRR